MPAERLLCWSYMGRIPYGRALDLQQEIKQRILTHKSPDTLLLVEHPPVITLGRSARPQNVLLSQEELRTRGVDLVQIHRGGDVTYHGPGQLVGYPLRQVGRSINAHVRGMVQAMSAVLKGLGIQSWWRQDQPGLWTAAGKIAAVGVDARRGVAMHGFALNVFTDLRAYEMIIPCGYAAPMTSVEALIGEGAAPGLASLARELAQELAREYGARPVEMIKEELLSSLR